MVESLPHLNATLNLIAGLLLCTGYIMIKRGQESAHRSCMLSAFGVSALFLTSYVTYHALAGSRKFPAADYSAAVSVVYYIILATHVVLAAAVPFLAAFTIYLAFRDRRQLHRKVARWTFPIWIYVSVTGVLVYLMLYWWFVPNPSNA